MADAPLTPSDETLAGELSGSVVRHAASYLGGILVSIGAVSHDQGAQTTAIIASILTYGLAQGWSWYRKWKRARGVA